MRTLTELLEHLWDDDDRDGRATQPLAVLEADTVVEEFREEGPTIERPRNRRRETLDERTLVFRTDR